MNSSSFSTGTNTAEISTVENSADTEQHPTRVRRLALVAGTVLIALLATLLNAGGAQARTTHHAHHHKTYGAHHRTHRAHHTTTHRAKAPVVRTVARTGAEVSYANAVLSLLNAERAANHLPALTMNAKLINSGRAHNLAMAKANTMSHQLPGEAFLGTRVTQAGYTWHWAGENIGWNSDISAAGVLALEKTMYAEVAPNDGHKLNILSTHFTNVGIDTYVDNTHHKVWLTCDFGRP